MNCNETYDGVKLGLVSVHRCEANHPHGPEPHWCGCGITWVRHRDGSVTFDIWPQPKGARCS